MASEATTRREEGSAAPRVGPPAGARPARSLPFRGRRIPVVLPSIRDPRLHLASVIITIHVLGQLGLGFQVSVVQILTAILTCAVIEVVLTYRQTGTLVWPASAMLTGSGVALIFRVLGTQHGDYWSTRGWYLFAIVAGLSLLTKYWIRYRGSHVFNPSNVGLVVAFVVLGSTRVEPLDFWWGPLDGWMVAAYAVILVGGILITKRLRLLAMSAAFWLTLVVGIGILAASGHCMVARWASAPVCGAHYWWIVLTSPEVLIFLFFMITDPKTVPAGGVGRIVFAAGVGLMATLLMAPQTTEFGSKVALLAGLAVLSVARLPFTERVPAADGDRRRRFVARLAWNGGDGAAPGRAFGRGAVAGAAVVLLGSAIVAAGSPAREPILAANVGAASELTVEVDPSALPTVTVDPEVSRYSADLAGTGAQDLAVTLAENLEVEAEALRGADGSLLPEVDFGDRLREMQRRVDAAVATGETTVERYTFESLHLVPLVVVDGQGSLSLGLQARGSVEAITYAADETVSGRTRSPFAFTFVLSRSAAGRWMIADTRPPE
jgi:Na+-translocating ferredoxin:NAD+ oxidoreductase RnfD subunit